MRGDKMLALIPIAIGFITIILFNNLSIIHGVEIPFPVNIPGVQVLIIATIYIVVGYFKDDDICMCFDCQMWTLSGFLMLAIGVFALIVQFGIPAICDMFP
jgi:hypothetical protein